MVLTSVWLIGSAVGSCGGRHRLCDGGSAYGGLLCACNADNQGTYSAAAFYIAKCFMNGSYFKSLVGKVIGGTVAEIIMVAGYFVYAIILYGNVATAAAGIFGNAIQGAVGLIAGVLLTVALEKAGTKKLLGFDK